MKKLKDVCENYLHGAGGGGGGKREEGEGEEKTRTDLDHVFAVHDGAVVGVVGQVAESYDGAASHCVVLRHPQVADHGVHHSGLPEVPHVVAPLAAVGDGQRQVAAESVVGLGTEQNLYLLPAASCCLGSCDAPCQSGRPTAGRCPGR